MGQELAIPIPVDRKYDGRAMRALSDAHRLFVLWMVRQGCNPKACRNAAKAAGFSPNWGYELMRDEGIQAALREEATKKLTGAALLGVEVMCEIARDVTHKDRYKAAKDLAAINGFTAEQRIVVEHVTPDMKGQLAQIRSMAQQLGLDPALLIAKAGISEAEDGEFEEVDDG
jgi:hypothetical protein